MPAPTVHLVFQDFISTTLQIAVNNVFIAVLTATMPVNVLNAQTQHQRVFCLKTAAVRADITITIRCRNARSVNLPV
jgi:adenosine/AMP kinase